MSGNRLTFQSALCCTFHRSTRSEALSTDAQWKGDMYVADEIMKLVLLSMVV